MVYCCFFSDRLEKREGKDDVYVANSVNFRHAQGEQKVTVKKSLKLSISYYDIIVLIRGRLK
jgi:hypothetical protein